MLWIYCTVCTLDSWRPILFWRQASFVSFCLLRPLISVQHTVFLPGHWSLQVEKYTEPGVMHVTLLDMEAKNIFCRLIYWAKKQRFSSAEKYSCLEEHCTLCTVLQILWLCKVNKTYFIFHVMSTVDPLLLSVKTSKNCLCILYSIYASPLSPLLNV